MIYQELAQVSGKDWENDTFKPFTVLMPFGLLFLCRQGSKHFLNTKNTIISRHLQWEYDWLFFKLKIKEIKMLKKKDRFLYVMWKVA